MKKTGAGGRETYRILAFDRRLARIAPRPGSSPFNVRILSPMARSRLCRLAWFLPNGSNSSRLIRFITQ
jgi:hypothetical protein